jgi:FkbM family methyltransferase
MMKTVTMYGKEFSAESAPEDFWSWVSEGRYDSEWMILQRYLCPEHTFIDLGAWVGSHSLFASSIAKRVLAVEPDPVAFPILESNAATKNIETVRVAITGNEGVITLGSGFLGASTTRANRHAGAGIGAWEPGQQFDIPCTTLHQFVKAHDLQDPMFIKMDVEGSEEQILQDFEFFEQHKPTLYLELHPFWWNNQRPQVFFVIFTTQWDSGQVI